MGIVNGIRTVDSLLAGNMSGAQLETWLGTGINNDGFIQAINSRSQTRVLSESTTALTAIASSPIALNSALTSSVGRVILPIIAANSTLLTTIAANASSMTAIAGSASAMAVIAESNTLLGIVFGSATPKTALYDVPAAQTVLFASANAKAYMVSIAATASTASSSNVSVNTGKTFFIQQRVTGGSATSYAGVSADTYTTASSTFVDRFVALTGLTHRQSGIRNSEVTYIDMD